MGIATRLAAALSLALSFAFSCGLLPLSAAHAQAFCPDPAGNPGRDTCGAAPPPAVVPNPLKNDVGVGNPINLISGNKYQREVDMPALPGVLGLEVVRHYNSHFADSHERPGIMGRGWRLSYESVLHRTQHHAVHITQADGSQLVFLLDFTSPGIFRTTQPADGQLAIVKTPDGDTWAWRWPNGRTLSFDMQGRLRRIRAATGEVLTLAYHPGGLLKSVTDPQQRTLRLGYRQDKDAFNGVEWIDTPVGRLDYSHGTAPLQGIMIDPQALKANLTGVHVLALYDPAKKHTDTLNRTYHYEDPRHPTLLTGISARGSDRNGQAAEERVATWRYQDNKAIGSMRGNGVEKLTLDFGTPGSTILTNSLGQVTTYRHANIAGTIRLLESRGPGCASCAPTNVRYRYDGLGFLNQTTRLDAQGQPIETTHTTRDRFGRALTVGRIAYVDGKPQPLEPLVAYDYDEPPQHTLANPQPTLVERASVVPGKQHRIRTTYNDIGQPLSVTEEGWTPATGNTPATPLTRTTRYTYGVLNGRRLLSRIDGPLPNGKDNSPADSDITEIRYDTSGNHPLEITSPGNRVTRFTHFDKAGRAVMTETDDGINPPQRIKTTYNAQHQPIEIAQVQNPDRTRWQRVQADMAGWFDPSLARQPLPALITRIDYDYRLRPSRVTHPDGTWQQAGYDAAGRIAGMRDQDGNVVKQERDSESHLLATLLQGGQERDPLQVKTQFRYDDQNRLAQTIAATGAVTRYAYDASGQLSAATDPLNRQTGYRYDSEGRLVALQQNAGSANAATTTLAYQPHAETLTAANGAATRTTRDDFGRDRVIDSPDSGTQTAYYDEADRLASRTDGNGNVTRYTYNAAGQLVERVTSGKDTTGKADTRKVRYRYEGTRLAAVEDRYQDTRYAYDANGRLTEQIEELAAVDDAASVRLTTQYQYDELGRQRSKTLPGGDTVRTTYGPTGKVARLDLVSADGETSRPLATDIRMDQLGLTGFTHGNGLATRYRRDTHTGQLVELTVGTAGKEPLYTQRLTYDIAGRITAIQRGGSSQDGSKTARYGYDAFDHLNRVGAPTEQATWTYDAVGNRTASSNTLPTPRQEALAYQPASNRLMAVKKNEGDVAYAYDRAGNPVRIGARRFVYGIGNRMEQVFEGAKLLAQYRYNAQGERIAKTVPDDSGKRVTTYFLYDENRLATEVDASGEASVQYFYLAQNPIAKLEHDRLPQGKKAGVIEKIKDLFRERESGATRVYPLHVDHLGTPQFATDALGRVVWQSSYKAFGEAHPQVNRITQNLRLPGQYHDKETNLHYNYFRDYDPQTGRYAQSDPIGLEGGINTYAYVGGNPLSFIDPSGLWITATYDHGTGNLHVYDSVTDTLKTGKFGSGGKPFGDPIPNGDYDILQHPDPDFYRLEPVDSKYGDDVDNRTGRDEFRLHKPGRTFGCIAAEDRNGWKNIRDLIRATSTDQVNVKSKSRNPWAPSTEKLIRYGRVTVVNSK